MNKTMNESENLISKPLLAEKLDNVARLRFPVFATPKLDGIRCLKIKNEVVSRTFKPIRNKKIYELLSKYLPENADGEIMLDGTFQDVTSAVMKVSGTENFDKPFTFYWFDYVKDDSKKPYLERIEDMKKYIEENPEIMKHEQMKIVPLFPIEIKNKEELSQYEAKCLEENFEGVMVRSGKGIYKMGRSTVREGILLKIKRFNDAEAVITECIEGEHNDNEKELDAFGMSKRSSKKDGKISNGMLGAFLVINDKNQKFKIGTGMDHSERRRFWDEREQLIGKYVKYKYFEIGSRDAPRFPTFMGIRSLDDM